MVTESVIFGSGDTKLIVKVLEVAPPCTTVKVCPATVNVPVRVVELVLAITVKLALPLPVPLPLLIEMKLALLVADHAQAFGATTDTDPLPPTAEDFASSD